MFNHKLILTLFFFLVIPQSLLSASFDCNSEKTNIEKIICSNSEISVLDNDLSKAYFDTKNIAKKPNLFKKNQLEWLKKRNKCKNESCIISEYKVRKEFIANWLKYEINLSQEDEENATNEDFIKSLPEGSSMRVMLNLDKELSANNSKLQKKFDELINIISDPIEDTYTDSATISSLIDQQKSWSEYIKKDCYLIAQLSGTRSQWVFVHSMTCNNNLIEKRISDVKSAIECVKKVPLSETWQRLDCLCQLATNYKLSNIDS
jgi:uncharacterized protein YecT (DUF1311 family)